jgi:hypothetical protein
VGRITNNTPQMSPEESASSMHQYHASVPEPINRNVCHCWHIIPMVVLCERYCGVGIRYEGY